MHPATRRLLNAVNGRFYRDHARAFSDTRTGPWPGWSDVLGRLAAGGPADRPLACLDVGCGNGRFGRFLHEHWSGPTRCLGVDASRELLEIARECEPRLGGAELFLLDVVEGDPECELPRGPFDLAVLFGVLHHVPGFEARRTLVRSIAERLTPDGLLALTVWPFADLERFRRRILPWEEYNRTAPEPVDPAALEPGDVLLRWGHGEGARYFHLIEEDELGRLLAGLGVRVVDRFEARFEKGGGNLFLLIGPGPAQPAARERA